MICEKNKCTGCFACYNICPKKAIEMIEDDNGFIYPQINKEKCIDCGLCKKVCPTINKVEMQEPIKCYAAYSKNKEIREESTSGGVATTISNAFINNGGIVYGAAFTTNCNIEHIRITNPKDLHKLQGSKYAHSYINNTYELVKKDLIKKENVLFFGTPCQIAGLKKYLMKEYDNLFLIDIICHGVPSQKYLKEEVLRIINTNDIERVNFRNNNNYGIYIVKDNEILNSGDNKQKAYVDAFKMCLSLRENCYKCIYAGSKRISDITIGDFWGLSKESKYYKDRDKGISVVIINNNKGEKILKEYNDNFDLEEREYKEAVTGNTQLMHPAPKPKNAEKFKKKYPKLGFYKTYNKLTIISRVELKIKNVIKKIIKK